MDIAVNSGQVDAALAAMPLRTSKAMVRALNRGINSARTVMVSRIARDTGLRSKDVRDAVPVTLATLNRPVARLAASMRRIPLIKFGARGPEPCRGKGRGVTYKLPGGGGRGRIADAFIATMRSGHRGVFRRATAPTMTTQAAHVPGVGWFQAKRRRAGAGRLPIIELQGPSIGRVFARYKAEAAGIAQEMFDRNFERELKYQASRAGTD